MTDWERVTPLADGRRVVTTASRHEQPGTQALAAWVTTGIWRGQDCLAETTTGYPPHDQGESADEWLAAVHAQAVAEAAPRDLRVATLTVPGYGRSYVVVELQGDAVDVLTAPFATGEGAAACVAWIRGEYDRLDAEWRAHGLSPIDVRWEFQRQQKVVGA